MHAAGLAHSDLSYKNVLIDPQGGHASIIDIDGLVVPGKYPPGVAGTPDFIAPEVLATRDLPHTDPRKALPRRETDQHALSVLIYMYLLYRHPLRGRKVFDAGDTDRDELLGMGEQALFVENARDTSNRYDLRWLQQNEGSRTQYFLPWWDLDRLPYGVVGPYLTPLFNRAFDDGLHSPLQRPTADEWETALVKTVDLMQPCANPSCQQKWFVFDNSTRPTCPFCGTLFRGELPVLNLYSMRSGGKYIPDNHRVMVYHNQYLYLWHANRNVFPNEKLSAQEKIPVGYFALHNGSWCFVNQRLEGMRDLTENCAVPMGAMCSLADGKQLLLSPEEGGRLVQIQMVHA
jgi:serine/threonine protein kinase